MENSSTSDTKLGLSACVMLLVGAMIGSAIFSLSGLTILTAGPAAVLSWGIAGVIMLFYGMCMAELSCRFPKSGGVYYFPRLAFDGKVGQWLGWLSCWSCILTNVVAVAFSGLYVGIYLSVAFPWAAGHQISLAILSILCCLLLNVVRVDLAGKINAVIVLILLGTMMLYIGYAFFDGVYSSELLVPFFSQGTGGPGGFVQAIPVALIGYSGVIALAFMVSDVRHAQKNVPLSMVISIMLVVVVYVLMILSTSGLVDAAYLKEHPDMQFIPMFCACFTKLQHIPWLAGVISVAAVLALMTTMNVCVSINARALQAAAEDCILPRVLGRVNSKGVPGMAAMLTCLVAMAYTLMPEYTQAFVNFGAVFNILTMAITMVALIHVKGTTPSGSFAVPGGRCIPYVVLAVLLVCNGFGVFGQGLGFWGYTVSFILVGVIIKLISQKKEKHLC